MPNRSWTDEQLTKAVKISRSFRNVLIELNLVPAGGNYVQIKRRILELKTDVSHFTGKGWRGNRQFGFQPRQPIEKLLVKSGRAQSYKLKNRLIREGFKKSLCEICGWREVSKDGRVPIELDHINGDRLDNRLENLRILCPNCHSLQSTHRGKNKNTH